MKNPLDTSPQSAIPVRATQDVMPGSSPGIGRSGEGLSIEVPDREGKVPGTPANAEIAGVNARPGNESETGFQTKGFGLAVGH